MLGPSLRMQKKLDYPPPPMVPGSALRTLVELLNKPRDVNKRPHSLA